MAQLKPLPVDRILDSVISSLKQVHPSVIVTAPPGSGKSTRIPVALSHNFLKPGEQIWVLEPRRIAARSLATFIAQENNWSLGSEVGYRVRFENKSRPDTKIVFMTEGLFIKSLLNNPNLERVAAVVFDEFHERSLDTDLGIVLAKHIQKTQRPDLKIVVMSATLNASNISKYLDKAPIIESDGALFSVQINYLSRSLKSQGRFWESLYDNVVNILRTLHNSSDDVLVFLPGQKEIRDLGAVIRAEKDLLQSFEVFELHSKIDFAQQMAIVQDVRDKSSKRRVILSTNIAESSLTVPRVRTVIDSGYERILRPSSQLGIDKLETQFISKHSATQRAGRSARLGPGHVYRLWTAFEETTQAESQTAEILRLDLKNYILQLLCVLSSNLSADAFFERPPTSNIENALQQLLSAGLIESIPPNTRQTFRATALGKKSAQMPFDCVVAAAFIWGLESGYKISTLAKVFAQISEAQVHLRPQLERQILTQFESQNAQKNTRDSEEELFVRALPQNISVFRKDSKQKAQMVGGRGLVVRAPVSITNKSSIFVALNPFETTFDKHLVATVDEIIPIENEQVLKNIFPGDFSTQIQWQWLSDKRQLKPVLEFRYLDLVLETSRQFPKEQLDSDLWQKGVDNFISQVGKEWSHFCQIINSKTDSLFQRLWFLSQHCATEFKNHNFEPFFESSVFLNLARDFLLTLPDVRPEALSFDDFLIEEFLQEFLNSEQVILIQKMAPTHIRTPQGQNLPIEYPQMGDTKSSPKLTGKIQAFFGLKETPLIGWGKTKLTVELLTPGYKPIQTTQDLKNFWAKTYFEIKNPLRARYPKHKWPDDPNQF